MRPSGYARRSRARCRMVMSSSFLVYFYVILQYYIYIYIYIYIYFEGVWALERPGGWWCPHHFYYIFILCSYISIFLYLLIAGKTCRIVMSSSFLVYFYIIFQYYIYIYIYIYIYFEGVWALERPGGWWCPHHPSTWESLSCVPPPRAGAPV